MTRPSECPVRRGVAATLALLVWVVGPAACVDGDKEDSGETYERETQEVEIKFDRETVIDASVLEFELVGTSRIVADEAKVHVTGERGPFGDADLLYPGIIERKGDVGNIVVKLPIEETLWVDLEPSDGEIFTGSVEVRLEDDLGTVARGSVESTSWTFRRSYPPRVESVGAGEVYVGQRLPVEGSGFLRSAEGTTRAVVESGELRPASGSKRDLSGEEIPLEWNGSRSRALLPVGPTVFGVRPASFEATLRFENERSTGAVEEGPETRTISGAIQESYIARLRPGQGSRGQKITVEGRGFIPTNAEKNFGMFFRYSGRLDPRDDTEPTVDFNGPNTVTRVPDRVVAEDRVEQSIWYSVEDRELEGLGATPGTFQGKITPVLFDSRGEYEAVPWEGSFEVLPTKQVIYLKYLPAFSKALERYGLAAVEGPIRDRVRTVVERDYSAYHVDVRERKPTDFLDYATIELGGPDPSGKRAFGFDNSFNGVAKDTGNLFLADYLGGVNEDAAAEFNNPYGGIFLSSFVFFSEELSSRNPDASPAFDRILEPFMPKLGGTPVRADEWPDGERADKIKRAVQMVGSVVGNTVTHEVGHSMGMTFVPGDFEKPGNTFHNKRPGPYIMDAGSERPFEERAEIDGAGPPHFNSNNAEYLERILPKPE